MKLEDQVKASVAYCAGASRETSTDWQAMLGAIEAPARNATRAKATGASTKPCSRSGTAIVPVATANWRSMGARIARPPKTAPPMALPSEFTERKRPPSAGRAMAVAKPG